MTTVTVTYNLPTSIGVAVTPTRTLNISGQVILSTSDIIANTDKTINLVSNPRMVQVKGEDGFPIAWKVQEVLGVWVLTIPATTISQTVSISIIY